MVRALTFGLAMGSLAKKRAFPMPLTRDLHARIVDELSREGEDVG